MTRGIYRLLGGLALASATAAALTAAPPQQTQERAAFANLRGRRKPAASTADISNLWHRSESQAQSSARTRSTS